MKKIQVGSFNRIEVWSKKIPLCLFFSLSTYERFFLNQKSIKENWILERIRQSTPWQRNSFALTYKHKFICLSKLSITIRFKLLRSYSQVDPICDPDTMQSFLITWTLFQQYFSAKDWQWDDHFFYKLLSRKSHFVKSFLIELKVWWIVPVKNWLTSLPFHFKRRKKTRHRWHKEILLKIIIKTRKAFNHF